MRLAGIFRYLGGNRLWDLRLVQSRKDFTRTTLEKALRDGMDGFIVAVPFSNDEIDFLASAKLPIVLMTDATKLASTGSRISRFFVDNAAIGRTAARYFLSRGQFKAFAYVADTMQSQWSDERERAFKSAVGGQATFFSFRRQTAHPEERTLSADELGDWLEKLPKPAAVLVANDHYAIQVLSACRMRSIRVPVQISVLGVDNDELLADNAVPTLSSIEPDFDESGYRAAAEMDRLLRTRNDTAGRKLVCGVKRLVERHSTVYLTPSAQLVSNVLDFIRRHTTDGITADDVARRMKVSRGLVDLRMREVHGKSLATALREYRLSLVKHRLANTDKPVIRILTECGYKNIRAAENLFRKATGLAPSAWRIKCGFQAQS